MAADPATVSIGRVIRLLDGALAPLPCVSLRYYRRCSCPDESTCAVRDVMIDVRDAMLEILDRETLAGLAGREGRISIDPRERHADALAGRRP
jgi:DNA-binding IscR family transcriptional regulator